MGPALPMTQGYLGSCTWQDPRQFWSCTRLLYIEGSKAILGSLSWVLHPARLGSCIARVCWPGAQDCRPYLADLHTLGSRGYKPAHPRVAARRAGLPVVPKARQTPCQVSACLGPRPTLAPGGCSWGRRQARVTCPKAQVWQPKC